MSVLVRALDKLDRSAAERVVKWAEDRYADTFSKWMDGFSALARGMDDMSGEDVMRALAVAVREHLKEQQEQTV